MPEDDDMALPPFEGGVMQEPMLEAEHTVTIRASRATKDRISKYGATIKSQGCRAIEREWKKPMAHCSQCRGNTMTQMLKEGDSGERDKRATENMMQTKRLALRLAKPK